MRAWQFVTYNAGEVINAKRNFPLGLLIGTAALVAIYLLSNLGLSRGAWGIRRCQLRSFSGDGSCDGDRASGSETDHDHDFDLNLQRD